MSNNLVLDWDVILSMFEDVPFEDWKKAADFELKSPLPTTLQFYDYSVETLDFTKPNIVSGFGFAKPKLSCRFDLSNPEVHQYIKEAAKSEADIVRVESDMPKIPLTEELKNNLNAVFDNIEKTRILYRSSVHEFNENKHDIFVDYDIGSHSGEIAFINFYARNFKPSARLESFALFMQTMTEDERKKVCWHLPTDMNFIFSIAHFRAARRLWQHLFQDTPCRIGGYTTAYLENDLHRNLIRATLQTAAMIIGGCDEIEIAPVAKSEEGHRWALNIFNLLIHESNLALVADAMHGSSAVESLTESIFVDSLALIRP